jgi:putative ABC transport system permease protein
VTYCQLQLPTKFTVFVKISSQMLRNYLKIIFRNLRRHKVFSLINILGLAVGMAACLMILLFIHYEVNFDGFHTEKDNVYRLCEVQSWDGIIPQKVALSMYPMGPSLSKDYPEVEDFARIFTWDDIPLIHEDKKVYVDKFYWADSAFLDIFSFPMLAGDPGSALDDPNTIIVTETTAKKVFGGLDVIGKQIQVAGDDTFSCTITGVMKDIPDASHLQFDGLLSLNTLRGEDNDRMMERWGNNWLVTYLKIRPGTDIQALEAKFPDFLTTYMGEDATDGYQLFLQSLADVHLGSTDITHDYQNVKKFDGSYISIFLILALFVLLIAAINFMNLSTARAAKRAREVGIRKTIGATRSQLARQFLAESVMFSLLAFVLAMSITALVIPFLNTLSLREMSFSTLLQPTYFGGILGVAILVGLLAGTYPAFFLASFNPIKSLKGTLFFRRKKLSLQNILVVSQFAIATALIIGTLLVGRQLSFMTGRDPGFQREQIVLLPMNGTINQNYEVLKDKLRALPDVVDVTASRQRLGSNIHQTGINIQGEDTAEISLAISHLSVDYNYFDLYEMELLDGRFFDESYATDSSTAFVINETMAQKIGLEDPVGKNVRFGWNQEWAKIIGLVKNFNYNTYHHGVNPLALSVQPQWGYSEISVKITPGSAERVLPQLEAAWRSIDAERPYSYDFLDEHFEELYRSDTQVNQVVSIITLLAIIVACLGLFGLISFEAERRTKELGVRKVLGASASQLMILFGKNVAILVIIAFVIAAPAAWWFMSGWLENFTYRIPQGWDVFVLAGLSALFIALLTISMKAYQASAANPVESLRDE